MIKTDAHFKTNVDSVYAIGDAIAGPMLAHKAEEEGQAAGSSAAVAEMCVCVWGGGWGGCHHKWTRQQLDRPAWCCLHTFDG